MSYVDAFFDRENDTVRVVERTSEGNRVFKDYPAKYTFYVPDTKGKHRSIYGEPLQRIVCKNVKEFRKELAINSGKKLYEAELEQ